MLKEKADRRSIAFLLVVTALFAVLWVKGMDWMFNLTALFVPLYILLLLMSVTVSVIVHNHKHVAIWRKKWLNVFTDNWLTVFYGFPVFAWLPTHMSNHHVHINTEEDYTKTYRVSERNNILTLVTYPAISAFYQQIEVFKYFIGTYSKNKKQFRHSLLQIIVLVVWVAAFFILDWKKALLFVVIPQQVSLYSVLIFNYIQHIHADEETKYNNSRNFTGRMLNFILINNGYHTAHHIGPAQHWSKLPAFHKKIEDKIHPTLNESNFGWYLLRVYVLGIFFPRFRTKSMRLARKKGLATYSSLS